MSTAFDFAAEPGHIPHAVLNPENGAIRVDLDARTSYYLKQTMPVAATVTIHLVPGVMGDAMGPYLRELIATLQMAEAAWNLRFAEVDA